jgi:Fe2+ transport system protein B
VREKEEIIQLHILDMAPDEHRQEYVQIFQDFMHSCDCILLVYSIAIAHSLQEAVFFYEQIMNMRGNPPTVVLVGNMCDLVARREVDVMAGERMAASLNCKFREVSAVTREGVDDVFQLVVRERIDYLVMKERQEEIERLLRIRDEEERQRELEEKERMRLREEELLNSTRQTTLDREKEQNEMLEDEMRRREAMKKAALKSMSRGY